MCGNLKGRMLRRLGHFVRSEDGPTATEYAVMLALIIVVALTAIQTMGQSLYSLYVDIEQTLFA
jgi:pilus assembly protein Flp/PilA